MKTAGNKNFVAIVARAKLCTLDKKIQDLLEFKIAKVDPTTITRKLIVKLLSHIRSESVRLSVFYTVADSINCQNFQWEDVKKIVAAFHSNSVKLEIVSKMIKNCQSLLQSQFLKIASLFDTDDAKYKAIKHLAIGPYGSFIKRDFDSMAMIFGDKEYKAKMINNVLPFALDYEGPLDSDHYNIAFGNSKPLFSQEE